MQVFNEKHGELDESQYQEQPVGAQTEILKLAVHSIGEEFNRPLGLIYNNCEYLNDHLARESGSFSHERTMESLADISHATLHLSRLVDNFVSMTASLNGVLCPSMQLVELRSMLQSVCKDATEIYSALGITLSLEIDFDAQVFVMADRTFAERICLNLLSNALNACSQGERVVFTLVQNENGVVLTVEDNGYGFPPQRVLSAFDLVQNRTSVREKGFERGGGMGLYLCSEYCRLMGWKIAIKACDPGTCVWVEIPKVGDDVRINACFHSSEFETLCSAEETRTAVLRELRTVRGLETLRR